MRSENFAKSITCPRVGIEQGPAGDGVPARMDPHGKQEYKPDYHRARFGLYVHFPIRPAGGMGE